MGSVADAQGPRALHPIFYGSFDWHSCVHGYWLIARLVDRFPELTRSVGNPRVDRRPFHPYQRRRRSRVFAASRGAWFRASVRLGVAARARGPASVDAVDRRPTIGPRRLHRLHRRFVERFTEFLPKSTYPLRVGTHFNTAFALTLAIGYARQVDDSAFETLIVDTARRWYLSDVGCQAWGTGWR